MRIMINCPPHADGRVLVGPSRLQDGYCRIVSERGGAGRIERFDARTCTWLLAPETVTFSDVWSAPAIGPVAWGRIMERFESARRKPGGAR